MIVALLSAGWCRYWYKGFKLWSNYRHLRTSLSQITSEQSLTDVPQSEGLERAEHLQAIEIGFRHHLKLHVPVLASRC